MEDAPEGKAKGGHARADSPTPKERKRIATEGSKRPLKRVNIPVANYVGVIKFGEGLQFPCAVLSNGKRVLTETDFMAGMGIYRSGALLFGGRAKNPAVHRCRFIWPSRT